MLANGTNQRCSSRSARAEPSSGDVGFQAELSFNIRVLYWRSHPANYFSRRYGSPERSACLSLSLCLFLSLYCVIYIYICIYIYVFSYAYNCSAHTHTHIYIYIYTHANIDLQSIYKRFMYILKSSYIQTFIHALHTYLAS